MSLGQDWAWQYDAAAASLCQDEWVFFHIMTALARQVREQLWGAYWTQWLADTGTLLQKLPGGLAAAEPGSPLLLTFERWLLQLKVRDRKSALCLEMPAQCQCHDVSHAHITLSGVNGAHAGLEAAHAVRLPE